MIEQIRQTIQEAFSDITFEEYYHTYKRSSGVILPSVSSKVKNHYNEFQADSMAEICAMAYNKKNDDKKTKQDFLNEWKLKGKESREKGTKIHKFASCYPNLQEPIIDEEHGVLQYYKKLPKKYEVVLLEFPLYSDDFAGTPDKILLNKKTGNLVISDWKTGNDLMKNYKEQKLKYPFDDLLDNPFNRYSIQQSLYKILLESKTPYKVEECWLIHLKDKSFTRYIALDLSKELIEYDERKKTTSNLL